MLAFLAAIAIWVALLNTMSGLVGGVWLLVIGQWRVVLAGVLFGLIMPFGYCIAFLPSLGLGALAALSFDRGLRAIGLLLSLLCWAVNNTVILVWTWYVFVTFTGLKSQAVSAPLLLWTYAVVIAPLGYMASNEPDNNLPSLLACLCAEVGAAALTILLLTGAETRTMSTSLVFLGCVFSVAGAFLAYFGKPPPEASIAELESETHSDDFNAQPELFK